MIVEHDLNLGLSRINTVDRSEKSDEFSTAMTWHYLAVNMAGQQVDPGRPIRCPQSGAAPIRCQERKQRFRLRTMTYSSILLT